MRATISLLILATSFIDVARADYLDDVGFRTLQTAVGPTLATGAGVTVSQIEAPEGPTAYLPESGTGTFAGTGIFSGKSLTAKSGTTATSGHAQAVASHFYSTNTNASLGRATLTPGITTADCYEVNAYLNMTLNLGSTTPDVETRMFQNHSYIGYADATSASDFTQALRRADFALHRDGFLSFVGVNNGAGNTTPELFASCYNNLSVGLTSGNHSTGGTSAFVDGPGRRKPEIVAPLDFTSFATPLVASAGVLLRSHAPQLSPASTNATRPQVFKACLLAGATKTEFPNWAKTPTDPIDATYGAGELNIHHSYQILSGNEQISNTTTALPPHAWDYITSPSTSHDYRLTIPAGSAGEELSCFITWHRTFATFSSAPNALTNYTLTLLRDPTGGGPPVTIDSSTSTIYNLEHVYAKNLPAGNYRLNISRPTSSGAASIAIAWRLSINEHQPQPSTIADTGTSTHLTWGNLVPGAAYMFQSSTDLTPGAWTDLQPVTGQSGTPFTTTITRTPTRQFWRLQPRSL